MSIIRKKPEILDFVTLVVLLIIIPTQGSATFEIKSSKSEIDTGKQTVSVTPNQQNGRQQPPQQPPQPQQRDSLTSIPMVCNVTNTYSYKTDSKKLSNVMFVRISVNN